MTLSHTFTHLRYVNITKSCVILRRWCAEDQAGNCGISADSLCSCSRAWFPRRTCCDTAAAASTTTAETSGRVRAARCFDLGREGLGLFITRELCLSDEWTSLAAAFFQTTSAEKVVEVFIVGVLLADDLGGLQVEIECRVRRSHEGYADGRIKGRAHTQL